MPYGEQLAWTKSYVFSICRCVLCVFYCDSSSIMQLIDVRQHHHQTASAGAILDKFSAISFLLSFTSYKRWLSSFIILISSLSSSFLSIKAPHLYVKSSLLIMKSLLFTCMLSILCWISAFVVPGSAASAPRIYSYSCLISCTFLLHSCCCVCDNVMCEASFADHRFPLVFDLFCSAD